MTTHVEKVREYLNELEYSIIGSMEDEGIFLIENEDDGISNMVLLIEDPILIMEQRLFDIPGGDPEIYKRLLQKNREIIHGALVLDEHGTSVIFRDTLQLENLDLNELEASINSLAILLSEMSEELLSMAKPA